MPDIKEYDNLTTIQVILFIEETLSDYYKKVKSKTCDLVSLLNICFCFSHCCPLCKGKDCAIFIGYYEREVVDEKGTSYKYFPIARYKCRRKERKGKDTHITFSLLPYQLVPYSKYSIPFIITALEARHEKGLSIYKLQEYLDTVCSDIISISAEHLIRFKHLINEALEKIMISSYYQYFKDNVLYKDTEQGYLKAFLKFSKTFESFKLKPSIRGPCALGYDFYITFGGYLNNAYFLFGTPSQFRSK